ncbi:Gfo/Idh/MocA family protein [Alteribacillus sp. HJP-4]|uniref:Gfo/Idh/MocA family protein n=1 Tax=Alteribacillus sp. HJP-4 TaxID=2775394 RepID=UPI0035CCE447
MNIATIGTNWITEKFIEAAAAVHDCNITAVYSRNLDRAEELAGKYSIVKAYDDFQEMLVNPEIDAVYIASPNRFHAVQAKAAMDQGKHVMCEKPLCSNEIEAERLIEVSIQNEVVLMEAIKTLYLPSFQTMKEWLPKVGKVRRVVSHYCQYSSRYDAFLEGNVLNAFDPYYSNGATMDLGVYCLYPLIHCFGEPQSLDAAGTMLSSGVDGQAGALLKYEDFEAIIYYSKIAHSETPSEIQGEKGTLYIDKINSPQKLTFHPVKGNNSETTFIELEKPEMSYEIEAFIRLTNESGPADKTLTESRLVLRQTDRIRADLGLKFDADRAPTI